MIMRLFMSNDTKLNRVLNTLVLSLTRHSINTTYFLLFRQGWDYEKPKNHNHFSLYRLY